jgi:hypothetical protein
MNTKINNKMDKELVTEGYKMESVCVKKALKSESVCLAKRVIL